MAEYIEREAFLKHMKGTSRYFTVKYDIEEFPAADVVPVVRCYQCKYYAKSMVLCHHEDGLAAPDKMDFCSYGERKDGDG